MSDATVGALAPKLVPEGEGRPYQNPGYLVHGKIFAFETNGQFAMATCEVEPGAGPPLHMHTLEDEAFFVLDGEVEITIGDEVMIVKAGSTVFAPRGIKHRFRGHGDRNAKMVMFVTGSNFEKFYARYEEEMNRPEPDMAKIMQISAEHGLHMYPDEA